MSLKVTCESLRSPVFFAAVMLYGLSLSPLAAAQAPSCDAACLEEVARQYMRDAAEQDYSRLPWGRRVRFTENNVAMMIGDGFWGAVEGRQRELFVLADESTGNVLWYGITEEHGQAAYYGIRLKVENRQILEVETYLGREGTPDLFAPAADYALDPVFRRTLPAGRRRPRDRMVAIADGYFNTRQLNDGALYTDFTDDCARVTNGVNVTHGDFWAADIATGCRAQLELGIYRPVDRIRARRYPIVDEATGVVVALSIEDHAARYVDYATTDGRPLKIAVEYPNSRGMLDLFKIENGRIARIEGISVFLPYYIHALWRE